VITIGVNGYLLPNTIINSHPNCRPMKWEGDLKSLTQVKIQIQNGRERFENKIKGNLGSWSEIETLFPCLPCLFGTCFCWAFLGLDYDH